MQRGSDTPLLTRYARYVAGFASKRSKRTLFSEIRQTVGIRREKRWLSLFETHDKNDLEFRR